MYQLINDPFSSEQTVQKTNGDGSISCIPMDAANRDYQEYLEWVAEGNTPEPAGE